MAGTLHRCWCSCHNHVRAGWEAARQIGDWQTAMIASYDPLINTNAPVNASDPVEAAAACDACRPIHSIALSDKPDQHYLPPQNWDPSSEQADGGDDAC